MLNNVSAVRNHKVLRPFANNTGLISVQTEPNESFSIMLLQRPDSQISIFHSDKYSSIFGTGVNWQKTDPRPQFCFHKQQIVGAVWSDGPSGSILSPHYFCLPSGTVPHRQLFNDGN